MAIGGGRVTAHSCSACCVREEEDVGKKRKRRERKRKERERKRKGKKKIEKIAKPRNFRGEK
jgi:hypothetical protein